MGIKHSDTVTEADGFNTTGAGKYNADHIITGQVVLAAGTTAVGGAPLEFQAGSLETTPDAGDVEYDGKVFYAAPQATQRGIILTPQVSAVQAQYTLGAITANTQLKWLPDAHDLVTLVGDTTYLFEGQIHITKAATTTCTVGTGFTAGSGLTVTSIDYTTIGWTAAATTTATAQGTVHNNGLAYKICTATGTTVAVTLIIRGIVRVNAGGTLRPDLVFSANPGSPNYINVGSYITFTPIGNGTFTKVGTWA